MPVVLPFINKKSQVLLQFLIDLFGLSISLGVVYCGQGNFNSKESEQLLHECSNKLWASIRDYLSWETVKFPDMLKVEVGSSSS